MFLGDTMIININVLKSPVACFWGTQCYANVNVDPFLTIINPFFKQPLFVGNAFGSQFFHGALILMNYCEHHESDWVVH